MSRQVRLMAAGGLLLLAIPWNLAEGVEGAGGVEGPGDTIARDEIKSGPFELPPPTGESCAGLAEDPCLISMLEELAEVFDADPEARGPRATGLLAIEEQWRYLEGAFSGCASDAEGVLSPRSRAFWMRATWLALHASLRAYLDAALESGEEEWIGVARARLDGADMPVEVGETELADQRLIFAETCGHPLFETCAGTGAETEMK